MNQLVNLLAGVPRMAKNVREGLLLHRTAERLGIAEEVVRQQYQPARRASSPRTTSVHENTNRRVDRAQMPAHAARILAGQPTRDDRLECGWLQCLVADLHWIGAVRQEIGTGDFTDPTLRNI